MAFGSLGMSLKKLEYYNHRKTFFKLYKVLRGWKQVIKEERQEEE